MGNCEFHRNSYRAGENKATHFLKQGQDPKERHRLQTAAANKDDQKKAANNPASAPFMVGRSFRPGETEDDV